MTGAAAHLATMCVSPRLPLHTHTRSSPLAGHFGKWTNDYAAFCGAKAFKPRGYSKFFGAMRPLQTPAQSRTRALGYRYRHVPSLTPTAAMCNDSRYFNNTFNADGAMVAYGDQPSDYLTSVIGNATVEWLGNVTGPSSPPFAVYIAPHAPHVPATPAPWVWDSPAAKALPTQSPRVPSWNYSDDTVR